MALTKKGEINRNILSLTLLESSSGNFEKKNIEYYFQFRRIWINFYREVTFGYFEKNKTNPLNKI